MDNVFSSINGRIALIMMLRIIGGLSNTICREEGTVRWSVTETRKL